MISHDIYDFYNGRMRYFCFAPENQMLTTSKKKINVEYNNECVDLDIAIWIDE